MKYNYILKKKIYHKHMPQIGLKHYINTTNLTAKFMRPIGGPPGADRIQVGPMLALWTLLSGSLKMLSL